MGLIAAAIHDVGHMGRNNLFYTTTMHALAIEYNDKSVLENMHLATSFKIMKDDESSDWFALLNPEHKKYMRTGLITMVLATDPSKHAKHSKQFGELVHEIDHHPELEPLKPPTKDASDQDKQKNYDDKFSLLCTLLHAADVSNPTKPQQMMLGWTGRLLQEFWAQGDEEKCLGYPISPLCDRETGVNTVPKGQLGFVNFVIQPFFKLIARVLPETSEAMDELAKNVEFWKGKDTEGATFEQIFGKPPAKAIETTDEGAASEDEESKDDSPTRG